MGVVRHQGLMCFCFCFLGDRVGVGSGSHAVQENGANGDLVSESHYCRSVPIKLQNKNTYWGEEELLNTNDWYIQTQLLAVLALANLVQTYTKDKPALELAVQFSPNLQSWLAQKPLWWSQSYLEVSCPISSTVSPQLLSSPPRQPTAWVTVVTIYS